MAELHQIFVPVASSRG